MESRSELHVIAAQEGIQNPDIAVKELFAPGEGFLGLYQLVNIRGKEKCLNLFVKRPPSGDDEITKEVMRTIYLNEFLFYDTIYPEFVKFENYRKCKNVFNSIAKCYRIVYEINKEVMILDDMKMKGYRSHNKKEPLDDAHMELILEEIAHFHAISFSFKDQKPEEFKKMADSVHCISLESTKVDFENTIEYITRYALDSLDSNNFCGYKVYESYSNCIRQFLNYVDIISEDFKVINHGDLTKNNILFQYNDPKNPKTPTAVCILDWQLTRVSSPVLDVSYFFYGICSENQMEHVEDYLDFYYKKLSYYIGSLGSDPSILYPQKTFLQQWNILARYGLAMSLLVIKIMFTEPDDILKDQTQKNSMLEALSYDFKNEKLYKEKIKSVITHFIENGYLEPLDIPNVI